MRIDLEYLAEIMGVFLHAETAHINLNNFQAAGINIDQGNTFNEKFVFHLQIALDNQLVAKKSGLAHSLEDLGVVESIDGQGTIVDIPIRLTQTGHDFACMLNNNEVLNRLKSEFKNAPFKVIFEGGQKILQHLAKKKLDALTN